MDSHPVCVRPSDIFSSPVDTSTKSPTYSHLSYGVDSDEKFRTYDSSPASTISYSDDRSFSPLEDGPASRLNTLKRLQRYLSPYQDQFNSHTNFPITLTTFEEGLLSTYLTEYSESVYGFKSDLGPHPLAVLLSLSSTRPACFHLILARTAQYRLSLGHNQSAKAQNELELAIMDHKGEAIQLIRNLSSQATDAHHAEDLIAAITGLGTLDQYSGAGEVASMHFGAVRQLLKSIGGPTGIQNLWLSRIMAHFESSYTSTTHSYVWDRTDFGSLHATLNSFFSNIWTLQRPKTPTRERGRQGSMDQASTPGALPVLSSNILRPNSVLHVRLSRRCKDPSNPTKHNRLELIFQLTSLFILGAITLDCQSDAEALQDYAESIHDLVDSSHLHDQSSNNIAWLLQAHDHTDAHSRRIWTAAGLVWILRHVNFNVQSMIRDWMVAILTGRSVARAIKLDSFAFSYAS